MKSNFKSQFLIIFCFITLIHACKNDDKETEITIPTGSIEFVFNHKVDTSILVKDVYKYVNLADNQYQINELRYFISEVTLYSKGQKTLIQDWKWLHYVDIDIPSTLNWQVYDKIAEKKYDSIAFIFGIRSEKNKSFMFVNPPEVNMMWPDVLGGGYHYLMLNGKWKTPENTEQFMNFHLGIGQIYEGTTYSVDSIKAFVDNSFRISFPTANFRIVKNRNIKFNLNMNVNSWFETPKTYDLNIHGGDIMQKQASMQVAKENGFDIFTLQIDSTSI